MTTVDDYEEVSPGKWRLIQHVSYKPRMVSFDDSNVQYLSNQFKKINGRKPSKFKVLRQQSRKPIEKVANNLTQIHNNHVTKKGIEEKNELLF